MLFVVMLCLFDRVASSLSGWELNYCLGVWGHVRDFTLYIECSWVLLRCRCKLSLRVIHHSNSMGIWCVCVCVCVNKCVSGQFVSDLVDLLFCSFWPVGVDVKYDFCPHEHSSFRSVNVISFSECDFGLWLGFCSVNAISVCECDFVLWIKMIGHECRVPMLSPPLRIHIVSMC